MLSRKALPPVGYEIRAVISLCGGMATLARACNITHCNSWKVIPDKHLKTVVRLSGLDVATLRPDLAVRVVA